MTRTRRTRHLNRLPKSVKQLQCGVWRRGSASTRKYESGCLGVRLPIRPVLLPLAVQPRLIGRMRAEEKTRAAVEEETTIRIITKKREILRQHRLSRDNSMTQEMFLDRTQTLYRKRTANLPANGSAVNSNPHASRIVIPEDQIPMGVAASSPGVQKQLKCTGKAHYGLTVYFYFWETILTYNPAHIAKHPTRPAIHRQSYAEGSSRQSSPRVYCIRNLRSVGTVFCDSVSTRSPIFINQETYEHNAHSCPNTARPCWLSLEHAH